jgi:hypothetical protein
MPKPIRRRPTMTLGRTGVDAPIPVLLGAVTLFLPVFRHTCPSRPKVWDELNAPRDIRTLELAILSEQKSPRLSSSLRDCRERPQVQDRVDQQAD